MRTTRKGKNHHLVFKLDIHKAFDLVKWDFLEIIMKKLGFCPSFVPWIMYCISIVSFSYVIGNRVSEHCKSFRGIRQEDPFSPFFIHFMLWNFLIWFDKLNWIKNFKVSRLGMMARTPFCFSLLMNLYYFVKSH